MRVIPPRDGRGPLACLPDLPMCGSVDLRAHGPCPNPSPDQGEVPGGHTLWRECLPDQTFAPAKPMAGRTGLPWLVAARTRCPAAPDAGGPVGISRSPATLR